MRWFGEEGVIDGVYMRLNPQAAQTRVAPAFLVLVDTLMAGPF